MSRYLILFLLVPFFSWAQTPTPCGAQKLKEQMDPYPFYQHAVDQTFEKAKQWAEENLADGPDSVLNVPVVVHILYENEQENLDDSLVYSQLEVLNRDFARLNADTINTRSVFDSLAANTYIQFFLATQDPFGNPTNGINRVATAESSFIDMSFELDKMKDTLTGGVNAWPVEDYLNIWVCDLAINLMGESVPAILGYAYPPAGLDNWPEEGATPADPNDDGVVIHYEVFGRNNPYSTLDMMGTEVVASAGRTCVHEVGHYLGLRHIWGDGDCEEDDGLADTPKADDQSQFDCDTTKNTCVDVPFDFPDMVENYMDYSHEECQNMFTKDQANLMYAVLSTDRFELLLPDTFVQTVVRDPIQIPVKIFPNPAQEELFVQWQSVEGGDLRIIDMKGRVIFQETFEAAEEQKHIDSSYFIDGTYVLLLEFTGGEKAYARMTVQ